MAGFVDLVARAMPYLDTEEITASAGASWEWTYPLLDNDEAPIVFTGITGTCKLREYVGGPVILTLTVDFPTAGLVRVTATAAQTIGVVAGRYLHEVELTNGTYTIKVVGAGDSVIVVKPQIV